MTAKEEYTAWRVRCLEYRVATLEDQLRRATEALEEAPFGPSHWELKISPLLDEFRASLWDYEEAESDV